MSHDIPYIMAPGKIETVFSSNSAVSRVTNDLNLLRGPIAHCTLTEELERDRLVLAVK